MQNSLESKTQQPLGIEDSKFLLTSKIGLALEQWNKGRSINPIFEFNFVYKNIVNRDFYLMRRVLDI